MVRISRVLIAVAAAGLLVSACTIKKTERPPLAGPSELALSLSLSASPDILTQDGSSQSHVVILARDQNGQAVKGLPLHVEIAVNGVITAFGQLSSQNVTTGSDGRATLSYTAPPLPPDNVDSGTIVTIRVFPTGADYANTEARSVNIRLVPPGFVPSGPTASYTYLPAMPVPNSPVTFDASASKSNGTIVVYSWDFGDDSTGTGVNPQHTYRAVGDYQVTLIVVDDQGRMSNPCTQTVTVAAGDSPTANFVVSPSAPTTYQTVFFNASTSTPGAGRTIVDYAWNFGAGASQHGMTVTTSYDTPGSYNVTLVVTDDVGQTASKSQSLTVATGGLKPLFTYSPSSPAPGMAVQFDASTSTSVYGIASYEWEWGDATYGGLGVRASHIYGSAGTYIVSLTLTDVAGHKATGTGSVIVAAGNPKADFATSVNGTTVVVDASASTPSTGQTITSYEWVFGDSTTVYSTTSRTYSHTYAGGTPGTTTTFTITLTVTDSGGGRATTSKTVTISW